ncbi:MAG: gfo/Idh/MocA family oxidoreductase [Bacteroidetes bacterium HGW-Bacteroidetes-5]|jgi:hypothetical protein|nr:MAG: gfo/Idh/MocA family oxidoreductase [Bacteroidetes bacterium HGW-Bacteroidetes-5]
MIRIGIICPSEIALRRFLPALKQLSEYKFSGVAFAQKDEWDGSTDDIINKEKEKAEIFINQYGGELFNSYSKMIESDKIDAVYLPLPPSIHFKWAKYALQTGKHILVEKPASTSLKDTIELIALAKQNSLAIHENYMFIFHDQLKAIEEILQNGEIGDNRLFRISFGFPLRSANDFRYNKVLGGGALLDCGGYTIKYASMLLGKTAKIVCANSNYIDNFDIDISGTATLVNKFGNTVQLAFGMDNFYKCDLEVWGNMGYLSSGRVFTAPEGFVPEILIKVGNNTETRKLPADDAFKKSIQWFKKCIENESIRKESYAEILTQAKLVDDFIIKTKNISNE